MTICKACGEGVVVAVSELSGRILSLDPRPTVAGVYVIVDRNEEETPLVQLVPPGNGAAFRVHECPEETP